MVRIAGGFFLSAGLFSLFSVPAEFSSFYAFTKGGLFQFEGFGFGSLLFAFIFVNTMLYAALAAICIPIGIGNIKLTYWGYRISRIITIAVIVIGVASTICIGLSFRLLDSFRVPQYIMLIMISLTALVVFPYLILRFYNNQKTKQIFNSSRNMYFENQSEQKIAVILLNLVWVMFFAVMILLKGAFPFLGRFIFETEGTYILSSVIFTLLVLNYLYYRNVRFTKYALLIFYAFIILSVVVTFLVVPLMDFINMLGLPAYEMSEMASLLTIVSGINPGFFFAALIVIQTLFLLRETNCTKFQTVNI